MLLYHTSNQKSLKICKQIKLIYRIKKLLILGQKAYRAYQANLITV